MPQWRLCTGRVSAWRSTVLSGIALFFLSTTFLNAQDVAEAARREQARKAAKKNTSKHVYTDDDLKKAKILTPDDETRVAARKRHQEQTPADAKEQQQPPHDGMQTESLGEVARRYRNEKEAREAEEAAKKSYTPFLYDLPKTLEAAPRANVGPMVAPDLNRPNLSEAIQPSASQEFAHGGAAAHRRVSPFQPRPLAAGRPAISANSAPTAPPIAAVPRPTFSVSGPALERRSESGLQAVTVKRGDSWWRLAAVYLGSGSRWTELRAMNAEVTSLPELLKCGAKVFVPDGKGSHVDSSSRTDRATQLRIKAGDTLWTLAREHLGRGSAWTCLASANPQIQDYRRMTIGTVVELPQGGASHTCAEPR